MGVQLKYGTAGATGGGYASQPGSLQTTFDESAAQARFSWQRRSPTTRADPMRWYSLWSFGCRIGGGDLEGYTVTGQGNLAGPDRFESSPRDGDGCQGQKFIRGTAVDASDVAISGAVIQAFVTSTDAFAGEVQSLQDGTFMVPTQNPGVAHYVVAYKPGSPDIGGTTVNTLIPTNVDGS